MGECRRRDQLLLHWDGGRRRPPKPRGHGGTRQCRQGWGTRGDREFEYHGGVFSGSRVFWGRGTINRKGGPKTRGSPPTPTPGAPGGSPLFGCFLAPLPALFWITV